ncbi:hemin receptor [Formosa agariphila KMM 3901]|uniref:Hemin receptor n=1 Tax=Formosa agariphila (strain DSM 15362 / KCTC 12365 / LMG 23005 / KMM 3901 / M-2Alg 35-1) TaxID=1347342 RepID=T2KNZ1_FORAG|nr:outer membrane protein transport protein [Formosa agariphila]CDF80460.1 hemin receptor [Formosa agariphila KMM 3901]
MNFKTLVFILAGILTVPAFYAQDLTDVVRYSQDNIVGSARFRALSGAFGALGGDLSASSLNPAGSAVFNDAFMSVTLTNLNIDNDTEYFNNHDSFSDAYTEFTQIGAAFVFHNPNMNSAFKKFTLAFTYDKTQDFKDDWAAHGINTNSIDGYFLSYADGQRLDQISAFPNESFSQAYSEIGRTYGSGNQQAFLGYESYIIQPNSFDDDNTEYTSNIAPGTFNQNYIYSATGYNGKIAVNLATQVKDRLYLGLNLNTHFINYDRITYLQESNSNNGSLVNNVDFENRLSTIGGGFSFQLGTIYKATDNLRVGLTYNSPTWYNIQEETSQYISTIRNENGSNINQIVNPKIVNIHPEYELKTPGKLSGSLAYIFGTHGLISFDYAYKDYSNSKFKPEHDLHFNEQNQLISNELKGASSYAVGGEYRLKQLSFRGGYRFEESPYKNEETIGDLTGYSVGLGYSLGATKLDVTFDQSQRDSEYQLYNVGLTDSASLDSKISSFTFSVSFAL